MARPTKYKKEYNEQAYGLCLLGYTDKELANHFGVNADTIYEWKNKYSEFSESIKRGKAPADAKVVAALYKRAIGYDHPETEKHFPPDATSAIFWLKNRQPKTWRDKKELDINKADEHKGKTREELEEKLEKLGYRKTDRER